MHCQVNPINSKKIDVYIDSVDLCANCKRVVVCPLMKAVECEVVIPKHAYTLIQNCDLHDPILNVPICLKHIVGATLQVLKGFKTLTGINTPIKN